MSARPRPERSVPHPARHGAPPLPPDRVSEDDRRAVPPRLVALGGHADLARAERARAEPGRADRPADHALLGDVTAFAPPRSPSA